MKKLASETVGKVLKTFLITLISIEAIVFTITVIFMINFDLYLSLVQIEQLLNIFIGISFFIMYIVYFIWMYKVHVDMQHYNINYPITPSKSVWSFLIPFYNLYGAWNVHSKLANNFSQRNHSNLIKVNNRIMGLLPIAYLLTFVDRFLGNYVNDMSASNMVISDFIWLSVEIVFLALLLTYWGLYKAITIGVRSISATNDIREEEASITEGA